MLAGGNVVPLDRAGSLEQPLFKMFQQKIAEGNWCHIFPEGKVRFNIVCTFSVCTFPDFDHFFLQDLG